MLGAKSRTSTMMGWVSFDLSMMAVDLSAFVCVLVLLLCLEREFDTETKLSLKRFSSYIQQQI